MGVSDQIKAWENFLNTGRVENYLEYKRITNQDDKVDEGIKSSFHFGDMNETDGEQIH
jgi:hypothetical protein